MAWILTWDSLGQHFFESSVDRGVLYVTGEDGVSWNGLISVSENPSGGAPVPYYIDGVRYVNGPSPEEYQATLSAFTYPDAFESCDGSAELNPGLFIQHQPRKPFSMSYRTKVGNDIQGDEYGYKIHLIYNATVAPSPRDYATSSDQVALASFAWPISVVPPQISAPYKSTGHVIIDSTKMDAISLATLEDILYGSGSDAPRMPDLDELIVLTTPSSEFIVTDFGDGSFSVEGPDSSVMMLDSDTFELIWPTIVYVDPDTYSVTGAT